MAVADVEDGGVEAGLVVQVAPAAALDPPVLADRRGFTGFPSLAIRVGGGTAGAPSLALRVSGEALRFQFLEAARAPGFELADDFLRVEICRDDDVQVIRAAVDGMQNPAANGAVVGDGLLDESSLFVVEKAGVFGHQCGGFELFHQVRKLKAVAILHPTSLVPRQPGAIRRPCEQVGERIRRGFEGLHVSAH